MGPYIADYVGHGAKLVIEVDGAQHGFDQHASTDCRRDEWFCGRGYRTLRFWNRDVLTRIDSGLDTIYAHLPPEAMHA